MYQNHQKYTFPDKFTMFSSVIKNVVSMLKLLNKHNQYTLTLSMSLISWATLFMTIKTPS